MTQHIFGKNLVKNAISSHAMNLVDRKSPKILNEFDENLNITGISRKAAIHMKSPTTTHDKTSNKISNNDLEQI